MVAAFHNTSMPLQRSEDFDVTAWIAHAKVKSAPRTEGEVWPGVFVRNLIPDGFPSYAKVLHAMYEDPTVDDSLTQRKRVFWRDLAKQCAIDFHAGINHSSFGAAFAERDWPKYLIGPGEGYLDGDSCRALVETLGRFTPAQPCWFWYALGLSVTPPGPRLYSGNLRDLFSLPEQDGVRAIPEYWWPQDQSWLVNSNWDLSFTLLGGSADLIQRCLESREIEALPITSTTRIDDFADVRNARKSIRRFAERFLSGEMSVIVAARTMSRLRHRLSTEFDDFVKPFAQADSASRNVPIGRVRSLWAPEALAAQDALIRKVEDRYLASMQEACRNLLSKV